jgi:hypothetical protein
MAVSAVSGECGLRRAGTPILRCSYDCGRKTALGTMKPAQAGRREKKLLLYDPTPTRMSSPSIFTS